MREERAAWSLTPAVAALDVESARLWKCESSRFPAVPCSILPQTWLPPISEHLQQLECLPKRTCAADFCLCLCIGRHAARCLGIEQGVINSKCPKSGEEKAQALVSAHLATSRQPYFSVAPTTVAAKIQLVRALSERGCRGHHHPQHCRCGTRRS